MGKGYTSEAARCLLTAAFDTFDLPTVHAITNPDNQSSISLLEKLGSVLEERKKLPDGDVVMF